MQATQQAKFNRRLAKILTRADLVDDSTVKEALEKAREGGSLTEALIEGGVIDEGTVLTTLARETGLPPIDVGKVEYTEDLLELVPENLARYYCVIPVARVGQSLSLAAADPYDI
ncbi:MAG: hypothetical protein ACE5GW_13510, partial [Planctomycetota bacterium]